MLRSSVGQFLRPALLFRGGVPSGLFASTAGLSTSAAADATASAAADESATAAVVDGASAGSESHAAVESGSSSGASGNSAAGGSRFRNRKPPVRVSNDIKEKLFQLYNTDSKVNSPRVLGAKFGLKEERVQAILKHMDIRRQLNISGAAEDSLDRAVDEYISTDRQFRENNRRPVEVIYPSFQLVPEEDQLAHVAGGKKAKSPPKSSSTASTAPITVTHASQDNFAHIREHYQSAVSQSTRFQLDSAKPAATSADSDEAATPASTGPRWVIVDTSKREADGRPLAFVFEAAEQKLRSATVPERTRFTESFVQSPANMVAATRVLRRQQNHQQHVEEGQRGTGSGRRSGGQPGGSGDGRRSGPRR